MYDILLRGGRVVDGTGNPWFAGDVALEDGRIAAIGDLSGSRAQRTLDLQGAVVAPGFIDLHTHADFTLPVYPRADAMVRQGVTTVLVGNCGSSPFPVTPERLDMLRSAKASLDAGLAWDWQTAAEYAGALERLPLACNVALQVGHGTVRIAAMGFDRRPPNEREMAAMERLVAEACEQGVFGFSTGLIYTPGSYAETDEIVALARIAGRYGAFYSTHPRGEGATLLEAVDEALTVGREAGVSVQLSHHKAIGERNWGRVKESLEMLDRARAGGLDVLSDVYPYTAGSTGMAGIAPQWAMEGGTAGLTARLAEPETRARIRAAITSDGPEVLMPLHSIMIAQVPEALDRRYEGMMLTDIAAQEHENVADTALRLLEHAGAVQIIVFILSEDDVRRIMQHPIVAIASDGYTLNPAAGGKPHPRSYGTYARVLARYVREEHVLRLEDAVRKMTSLPAQRLGRSDLGLIRPRCQADIVVFDPEQVEDRATYAEPHQFAGGVHFVIVNGHVVVDHGVDTGAAAGRILRRGQVG